MTDLSLTIAPKTDQLNADHLIGQNLTITITAVSRCNEPDQPIAINFDGDDGKPYKPCKSMRRVLVNVWGKDGNAYVGRRMTLFRDDKVMFGGVAVGGIRISHMSHINQPMTMALTATRANRKPFTVQPLPAATAPAAPKKQTTGQWLDDIEREFVAAAETGDIAMVDAIANRERVQAALKALTNGALARLQTIILAAQQNCAMPADEDEEERQEMEV